MGLNRKTETSHWHGSVSRTGPLSGAPFVIPLIFVFISHQPLAEGSDERSYKMGAPENDGYTFGVTCG